MQRNIIRFIVGLRKFVTNLNIGKNGDIKWKMRPGYTDAFSKSIEINCCSLKTTFKKYGPYACKLNYTRPQPSQNGFGQYNLGQQQYWQSHCVRPL